MEHIEDLEKITNDVLTEASNWKDTGFGGSVWVGRERARRIAQARENGTPVDDYKTDVSMISDALHKVYSEWRPKFLAKHNEIDHWNSYYNDHGLRDYYAPKEVARAASRVKEFDNLYDTIRKNLIEFGKLIDFCKEKRDTFDLYNNARNDLVEKHKGESERIEKIYKAHRDAANVARNAENQPTQNRFRRFLSRFT